MATNKADYCACRNCRPRCDNCDRPVRMPKHRKERPGCPRCGVRLMSKLRKTSKRSIQFDEILFCPKCGYWRYVSEVKRSERDARIRRAVERAKEATASLGWHDVVTKFATGKDPRELPVVIDNIQKLEGALRAILREVKA